jgi:hypothetical protein
MKRNMPANACTGKTTNSGFITMEAPSSQRELLPRLLRHCDDYKENLCSCKHAQTTRTSVHNVRPNEHSYHFAGSLLPHSTIFCGVKATKCSFNFEEVTLSWTRLLRISLSSFIILECPWISATQTTPIFPATWKHSLQNTLS